MNNSKTCEPPTPKYAITFILKKCSKKHCVWLRLRGRSENFYGDRNRFGVVYTYIYIYTVYI